MPQEIAHQGYSDHHSSWTAGQIQQKTQVKGPLEIDWVSIPAGRQMIGAEQDYTSRMPAHLPIREVAFQSFAVSRTPVTVAQFAQFVEETGYQTTAERWGTSWTCTGSDWRTQRGVFWRFPRMNWDALTTKPDHPVTCVSLFDATSFCRWLGARIPTEVEWEIACRGPGAHVYPWGNQNPDSGRCNFAAIIGDTTPVDYYQNGVSHFGLFDLSGNVWEWTRSLADLSQPDTDPADGFVDQRSRYVLRGGAFGYDNSFVRSTFRNHFRPETRTIDCGFRIVKDILRTSTDD